jgi:hypothetical protein
MYGAGARLTIKREFVSLEIERVNPLIVQSQQTFALYVTHRDENSVRRMLIYFHTSIMITSNIVLLLLVFDHDRPHATVNADVRHVATFPMSHHETAPAATPRRPGATHRRVDAGLQLAALSLHGRNDATRFIDQFSGSHRFVLDYLVDEVLQQQPAEVYTFLIHTAILDRLTPALCDLLVQRQDSRALLTRLECDNLFLIPLDDARQ